jgi:methylthioribose-1-phosphate isomerase
VSAFHCLEWRSGSLRMLDQRLLPHQVVYLEFSDPLQVRDAIRDMVVRGAPSIGAAAAWGLALVPFHTASRDPELVLLEMEQAALELRLARPTAVDLSKALDRVLLRVREAAFQSTSELKEIALAEANEIASEYQRINLSIAAHAQPLIPDPAVILHHCNTGALAAVEYGTALGVIRKAHELGKQIFCLVDETRPRLQGARLTAWELQQYGVPFKVIVDGASGHYMRTSGVDCCIVGCDRVAANGDTANKIGTYNLAVVAHENNVPFYVACPSTTIDLFCQDGSQIEIEERPQQEVTQIEGRLITPAGAAAGNPAFDVTPARYITAFITEKGVLQPPFSS